MFGLVGFIICLRFVAVIFRDNFFGGCLATVATWESFAELAEDFGARVGAKYFFEPARVGLGIFGGNNFYHIALLEFGI